MSEAGDATVPRRVPVEAGFFTIPESDGETPRLLGSRCSACGEVFFPRRVVCAKCLSRDTAPLELGPRGRLYTYTYTHVPMFGALRADLKRRGSVIGPYDLMIAAHARSLGLIVVTNNRREFDRVSGLAVEDWSP